MPSWLHKQVKSSAVQLLFVLLLLTALAQQIPGLPPVTGITRPEDAPETPQYLFNLMHVIIVLMLVAYYTTPITDRTNFYGEIAAKDQLSAATVAAVLMALYPTLNVIQYFKNHTPHFLPIAGVGALYALIGFGLAKYGVQCKDKNCSTKYVLTPAVVAGSDGGTDDGGAVVQEKADGGAVVAGENGDGGGAGESGGAEGDVGDGGKAVVLKTPLRQICQAFGFHPSSRSHAMVVTGGWALLVLFQIIRTKGLDELQTHPEELSIRLIELFLIGTLVLGAMGKNRKWLRVGTWGFIALLLYALTNHISDWFYLDAVLALVTFTTLRHTKLSPDAKPVLSEILCL